MQYCIQCTDIKSGLVGDFLHNGDFRAISPIYTNLADFFRYLKSEKLMIGTKHFEVVPMP